MKKKVIIIIAVIVVIGGAIGATSYYKTSVGTVESGAPKGAVPISVEPVKRATIITKVNADGEVILEEKEIIYSETQAKIEDITVEVGDVVTQGQVIVTYDTDQRDDLQDQLESAQLVLKTQQLALQAAKLPVNEIETTANESQIVQSEKIITDLDNQIAQIDLTIAQLETELADKQSDYANKQMLYDSGAIAKMELDAAADIVTKLEDQIATTKIQRESLVASKAPAEQNLALSKQSLNETMKKNDSQSAVTANRIKAQEVAVQQAQVNVSQIQQKIDDFETEEIAPTSGTVLSITGVEGSFSTPTMPIMEIGEISNENLVLQVAVPENKAENITVGQEVVITGDVLGDLSYTGVIEKILPKAEDRQIGTSMETVVLVNVRATGEDIPVRPGNTLTADITTAVSENVLVVPLVSTFTDEEGEDFVYVMGDDFKSEKRIVVLGAFEGLAIEATSVEEGEYIILDPPKTLIPGDFVDPINIKLFTDPASTTTPAPVQ